MSSGTLAGVRSEYAELFTPISLGTMRLRNRIVLAPTSFRASDVSYDPGMGPGFGAARIATYAAQARGGVGLIVMEDCFVDPVRGGVGRADVVGPQHPAFDRDLYVPALSELVDAVHAFGAKIVPELVHMGRGAVPADGTGPLAPSSQPNSFPAPFVQSRPVPIPDAREATLEDIEELREKFVVAAYRAKRARFDGVMLDGHHGALVAQFFSRMTNKRTDRYGGSLQNRMRFALEIVDKVRIRCGPDFPILFSLSGDELTEGGLTVDESAAIARELERAGVCGLFVAPGIIFPFPGKYKVLPPMGTPEACYAEIAYEIKKAVGIPVIANGNIKTPSVANGLLKEGKADLVALARALIADPDWPDKVRRGRLDDITPCISCSYCSETMQARLAPRCTVNFNWGRAPEKITPAPARKKVVVVGGGPAGMEAARVAALRGHDVQLLEAAGELGGQLNLAYLPPGKYPIQPFRDYLVRQIERLGVTLRLKTPGNADNIGAIAPDVVIVATGGTIEPPPSLRGNQSLVTAWDVLAGTATVGQEVVIVGGGATGCETAEYLLAQAKAVTVVEMQDEVAADMVLIGAGMRYHMLTRLERSPANILTSTLVVSADDRSVTVKRRSGELSSLAAETIVWAAGVTPKPIDTSELDPDVELFWIGDCVKPRNMLDAVWEGSRIARAV